MPKTYLPCADHDQSVLDMANELMRVHYRELIEAKVTISFLFCVADELKPAVTQGGYTVPAAIKVNSLKDRVEGKADCTLTIDKAWYDGTSREQCAAVIDQQIHRLLIAHEEDGTLVVDDCGRPKLKLKPYDWCATGFIEVAKRHRTASREMIQVREIGQMFAEAGVLEERGAA